MASRLSRSKQRATLAVSVQQACGTVTSVSAWRGGQGPARSTARDELAVILCGRMRVADLYDVGRWVRRRGAPLLMVAWERSSARGELAAIVHGRMDAGEDGTYACTVRLVGEPCAA